MGDVAGSVRFEELSSCRRLGLGSRYVSVWLEMLVLSATEWCK